MHKASRYISALGAVAVTAVGLAACGGGTSGDVVAQVGGTSITKAELNHWMSTLAGGDFYEASAGHTAPAGLVSEPPNYAACVARLQTAAASVAKRPPKQAAAPKPTAAQLLSKCRQLYQALKQQALDYLVGAQWNISLYGDEGVKATDREVMRLFNSVKAKEFPTEAQLKQYLASNRRSLADELFVVKLNLLSQKVQQKIATGGKQMLAKFNEAGQRWTAKTDCRAGYVVRHCKQYKGEPASSTPTPSILMEQVAVITGRPCINRPACT